MFGDATVAWLDSLKLDLLQAAEIYVELSLLSEGSERAAEQASRAELCGRRLPLIFFPDPLLHSATLLRS